MTKCLLMGGFEVIKRTGPLSCMCVWRQTVSIEGESEQDRQVRDTSSICAAKGIWCRRGSAEHFRTVETLETSNMYDVV